MKSSHPVAPLTTHRLHIVTGKGGTGKSTIAAAISIALADNGLKVLFAEAEQRQSIAALFGRGEMGYTEQLLLNRESGGQVFGLAIEPEGALLDYLELFYNLRSAGALLRRIGAISFATTVAPGLRDVLLTGKACEAVRRRKSGRSKLASTEADDWVYDAVVLDAPPTGRIVSFLNVTAEVVGMAKVGPIRQQADWVSGILHSPQSCIHMVATPEELPVQETKEAVHQLHAADFNIASVIVNMAPTDLLDEAEQAELSQTGVESLVSKQLKATVSHETNDLEALARSLVEFGRREQLIHNRELSLIGELTELGLPLAFLPRLGNSVGLTGITQLARQLNKAAAK